MSCADRAEGGQRRLERLADHGGPGHAGRPLGGIVPGFHASIAPDHEHAFVDRRDDVAQPGLGALHRLQHLRALHRAQHHQGQELHDPEDDHDTDQRPRGERRDLGQLGLGALLLVPFDRAEGHPDPLEGGAALRQVTVDRFLHLAFENRGDDLVAAREVGDPGAIERSQQTPAFAGVADGRQARRDRRDPGVGAARAIGVLDLPVAVRGGQRVEHAAPRFLDLVLQIGDRAETVDQPLVHQLRVMVRAPLIAVLEPGHRGGDEAHGGNERSRRAEPVEQAVMERAGIGGHVDHRSSITRA